MSDRTAAPRWSARLGLPLLLLALTWLGGCGGGSRIGLPYPSEGGAFAFGEAQPPRVFLGQVEDLRPPEQREGQGHFGTIVFPKKRAWEHPAALLYREALAQDLAATQVVELVPSPAQATYTLTAELRDFDCRLERSPGSFLLPPAAGMMGGLATGKTSSDRVKSGLVIGLALMLAVPMPAQVIAEADVRLTLRDAEGNTVWDQSCRGEVQDKVYLPVTAREDKKLAEKYLPRAVKRCNACLLGQLFQRLAPTSAGPKR